MVAQRLGRNTAIVCLVLTAVAGAWFRDVRVAGGVLAGGVLVGLSLWALSGWRGRWGAAPKQPRKRGQIQRKSTGKHGRFHGLPR